MHQPFTSDNFYHMVGWGILHNDSISTDQKNEACYQQLKQIISFGYIAGRGVDGNFHPTEGNVEISINTDGHLLNGDFDGFLVKGAITCFADIPWDSLGLHAGKYGLFGFGVSSAHLAKAGARPVIYVPYDTGVVEPGYRGQGLLRNITNEAVKLYKVVNDYEDANNPEDEDGNIYVEKHHEWSSLNAILLRDVAAYIKPYNRNLDIKHPECYYTEREWRLLGNVRIIPSQVPVIVVAKGYKERLLQEVQFDSKFEVKELGE
ncbi:abortive infection system antitoxin AbiGi family protein [Pseudomonas sp. LA21]|uniref:abortive infection system antitoxin AbiGi family protein n=1 Tax=Pseudomonas sp. LA21 TaxID=2893373 RepID=UPI001FB7F5A2|nr:abortive infection system antitoxin AbiGi family protein [Pseudomonas sp. LA21]MCJ1886087.1 abortive infection system antitoxin AbiGi family protein [Pseudomonas sp. LA21]